jgi:hypothetical protein
LALDEVYSNFPDFSQAHVLEALHHHDPEHVRREIEALRGLGVPE